MKSKKKKKIMNRKLKQICNLVGCLVLSRPINQLFNQLVRPNFSKRIITSSRTIFIYEKKDTVLHVKFWEYFSKVIFIYDSLFKKLRKIS